jgi:hypothetical protein
MPSTTMPSTAEHHYVPLDRSAVPGWLDTTQRELATEGWVLAGFSEDSALFVRNAGVTPRPIPPQGLISVQTMPIATDEAGDFDQALVEDLAEDGWVLAGFVGRTPRNHAYFVRNVIGGGAVR